jgi:hypothetical protein
MKTMVQEDFTYAIFVPPYNSRLKRMEATYFVQLKEVVARHMGSGY